jgi:uncharacterized SAM-binding protein YcdF (DUF218 family)
MGTLRRATVIAAVLLHTTGATILSSFDEAKLLRVDAILVLGGGAPPAPDAQLPFVAARCKAAAALWKAAAKKPKILTLSAGTAHVPQLLDARGSVVFEATASAAVIIGEGVDAQDVFVETTSYDTIGNAFYSRNDHCSLAGWRRLLVITSEFHLARTKAIFDWVYGAAGAEPSGAYELSYLGTAGICVEIKLSRRGPDFHTQADTGLTPAEVAARKAREDASTRNVVSGLAPGHRKLSTVREFLTTRHDLYSATGLVARAARRAGGGEDAVWAASYGGGRSKPASAVRTTPAVSPGAAPPAKPVCPPCEAATPAACGYSFLTVLVAFAVGAFLGGRKDRGHYRTY